MGRFIGFIARPTILTAIFLLLLGSYPSSVHAVITECEILDLDPTVIRTNTVDNIVFEIDNPSDDDAVWIKLTAPSNDFEIFTGSASGWSRTVETPTEIIFHSGTLSSGETEFFTITVQTGTNEVPAAPWTVQLSDDSGGASPFTCAGNTSVAISNDTSPPVISNISITSITSNSATIAWTTDENANSRIDFGLTNSYGSFVSDPNYVTSHSLNLTGLSESTTYHFALTSSDIIANTTQTGDNTFTTAGVPTPTPTATPIPTSTPTPTPTLTPTPTTAQSSQGSSTPTPTIKPTSTPTLTPTPIPNLLDQLVTLFVPPTATPQPTLTPSLSNDGELVTQEDAQVVPLGPPAPIDPVNPTIQISTNTESPFAESPTVTGFAQDNFNVATVQYSSDGGQNWLRADMNETGDGEVEYSFTPDLRLDGDYQLVVRAIDVNGNIGLSETRTLVIDKIPPNVSLGVASLGPQQLATDSGGAISTISGIDQTITVTTTGGATTVDVLAVRRQGVLGANAEIDLTNLIVDQTFALVKNQDTGFWHGAMSFTKSGTYDLYVLARDGAANETVREFGVVDVERDGLVTDMSSQPLADAMVTLYYFEPSLKQFVVWHAESFAQMNPQMTNEDGQYRYLAHQGKYYLEVKKEGYKTFRSEIFELHDTSAIAATIALEMSKSINLGIRSWTLPFQSTTGVITVGSGNDTNGQTAATHVLIGEELPFFTFESTKGESLSTEYRARPSVVTVLNSWSPQTYEQLPILDSFFVEHQVNVGVVISGEELLSATVLKERGAYDIEIGVDPNGEISRDLQVQNVPVHFFIDRKGIVKKVKVGVLSEHELFTELEI